MRCTPTSWLLLLLVVAGSGTATATQAGLVVPGPSVETVAIVSRHTAALGGNAVLEATEALAWTGTLDGDRGVFVYRGLVRREPFALREEFAAPARPDQGVAFICDGVRAWRQRAGAAGEPLTGQMAISMFDNVLLQRLLFDPAWVADRGAALDDDVLPETPGWTDVDGQLPVGQPVHVLLVSSPSGVVWRCFFEVASGRLVGLDDPYSETQRWTRLTAWRTSNGLTQPHRIVQGSAMFPPSTLTLDEPTLPARLPPSSFSGDPQPPRPPWQDVSELFVIPSVLPGSGYLGLSHASINGHGSIVTLLDTGAKGVFLDGPWARHLGLLELAVVANRTLTGTALSNVRWVDQLRIGDWTMLQIAARVLPFPGIPELLWDSQPRIMLGTPALQASAVLDLGAGRLLLRGETPPPLGDIPSVSASHLSGPTVFNIPYLEDPHGGQSVIVKVELPEGPVDVLLDTGFPFLLRLSRSGLQRLGLPTSRDPWLERGATPYQLFGAGGQGSSDLLVLPNEVRLGAVTFHHPYVLLAGLGSDELAQEMPWEGLLGTTALLPFARVGFDARRQRLELEPGPGVVLSEDGQRADVLHPGQFLGLQLLPPDLGATTEPGTLPRLSLVHPGSPAAAADLRPGDRLLAIDGVPCAGQAPATLHGRLWIPRGGGVTLTVLRAAPDDSPASTIEVRLP